METFLNELSKEIESLKDSRGFIKAGLPRFNRLFGRDSLITAWQLLDIEPEICRRTLEVLAESQGKVVDEKSEEEPGKIIHEEKGSYPFNYYGSVDSTPLFLILLSFYIRKTNDNEFLKKLWRNVLTAIDWMEKYGDLDDDGFLEYKRKNPKGLFHQGWKDGFKDHLKILPPATLVEVQGYQYLALKEVSNLSKLLGEKEISERLFLKSTKLRADFNSKFWMPDKKYFALALDSEKKQRKAITSNPGHLLFTGIIDKEKTSLVATRLFKEDLWTSYGIRTHSTEEPDFNSRSYHLGSVWPHDNWITAQGMKEMGCDKGYQKIKRALLRAYKEIGFIPEFYGVEKDKIVLEMQKEICHPQAWASGALLNFLSDR